MTYATVDTNSKPFDQLFLDCVEEAIRSILGEQVLKSFLVSIENFDGLTRDEIPVRMNDFFLALERAFGQTSGKTVGRFIIRVLYVRLGMEFNSKMSAALQNYVEDARRRLEVDRIPVRIDARP